MRDPINTLEEVIELVEGEIDADCAIELRTFKGAPQYARLIINIDNSEVNCITVFWVEKEHGFNLVVDDYTSVPKTVALRSIESGGLAEAVLVAYKLLCL